MKTIAGVSPMILSATPSAVGDYAPGSAVVRAAVRFDETLAAGTPLHSFIPALRADSERLPNVGSRLKSSHGFEQFDVLLDEFDGFLEVLHALFR
ncbi:hypothetical protein BTRA_2070 [Burkholderia thailandensis USAMRU Malaysia |nr:hypothetical protein BTQ_1806 [Burkholderia thailandensis 2002721723]AHI80142.1 hypothetical protein BTJ_549 [Burkholderia thailandensis E444]AIC85647.1 hypothetical protein BTRA_2070 [Burkholderia thailandensis USAMRU Malaysia \